MLWALYASGDVDRAGGVAKTPSKSVKRPAARSRRRGPVRRDKLGRPWRPRPQNEPRHKPNDASRAAVQALNTGGFTHEQIADYLTHMMSLPISARGVARYYKVQLALGKMHQVLVVSGGLYRRAAGAPAQFDGQGNQLRAEVKPDLTAQIFWLKAQAGWRDHQTVTIDPGQKPIPVSIESLTDKQLEELELRLVNKLEGKAK